MLTTIIYRSRLCDSISYRDIQKMVAIANVKNTQEDVTGILLFNGIHFFQLLEGPDQKVKNIYGAICQDDRHNNIVELLCDYAPARRFGKAGMELFDLRAHERDDVLQRVLDKGTSRYQLTYNDRALQFFQSFVMAKENANYFEVPPANTWDFVSDGNTVDIPEQSAVLSQECGFAFQPIIDPLAQEIIAFEALLRSPAGGSPATYLSQYQGDEIYHADLNSKKVAFAMAQALQIKRKILCINLNPMTLVKIPDAVKFLLQAIAEHGLVPEQVVVEFTEGEVISQFDAFAGAVRALKSAGIIVAIDNFGSGFAGLQLLAEFQPDRIKINRELIRDVHRSGSRQAIIHAIIKCCASLEIQISAVGIEKPEEWMWLEAAGIELFQGNLFAQPARNSLPALCWPEKNTLL